MIIRPFNLPFIILLLIFAGVFAFLTVLARKRGVDYARKLLGWVSAAFVPVFVVHVVSSIMDPVLNAVRADNGLLPYTIWSVLPFHLCYVNMLMMPVAVFSGNRHLEHFCAMTGPAGALAALCFPTVGYSDANVFAASIMTYYILHFGLIACGISIFTFRLVRPTYRDIPWSLLILVIAGVTAHIVNLILRQTGLYINANFCFTMTPEQIPPLEMVYSIIPVPLLYMAVAGTVLFSAYMFPLTAIVNAVSRRRHSTDDGGGQK